MTFKRQIKILQEELKQQGRSEITANHRLEAIPSWGAIPVYRDISGSIQPAIATGEASLMEFWVVAKRGFSLSIVMEGTVAAPRHGLEVDKTYYLSEDQGGEITLELEGDTVQPVLYVIDENRVQLLGANSGGNGNTEGSSQGEEFLLVAKNSSSSGDNMYLSSFRIAMQFGDPTSSNPAIRPIIVNSAPSTFAVEQSGDDSQGVAVRFFQGGLFECILSLKLRLTYGVTDHAQLLFRVYLNGQEVKAIHLTVGKFSDLAWEDTRELRFFLEPNVEDLLEIEVGKLQGPNSFTVFFVRDSFIKIKRLGAFSGSFEEEGEGGEEGGEGGGLTSSPA